MISSPSCFMVPQFMCSVVHEPAQAESSPRLEPARHMAALDSRLESSLQETPKKPPRGSSLELSRLVDTCPSRLESPRGSSRLVDPCSSRKELDAKRLELARLEPDLSLPGSCTTLIMCHMRKQISKKEYLNLRKIPDLGLQVNFGFISSLWHRHFNSFNLNI